MDEPARQSYWKWLIHNKWFYILIAFFIYSGHTLNYPTFQHYLAAVYVGSLLWVMFGMALHYYIVKKYNMPKYVVLLVILAIITLMILFV